MTDPAKTPTLGYLHIARLDAAPPLPDPSANAPASDNHEPCGACVGGYLIVCHLGRPLEFHCTAPVAATRAQSILYGRSLRPFLYGEHLGATLVSKARLSPTVLLVDDADLEAAGRVGSLPTVLLPGVDGAEAPLAAAPLPGLPTEAWLLGRGGADRGPLGEAAGVAASLRALAESIELSEPFERIRGAIAEAQQGVAASTDHAAGGGPARAAA